MKNIAIINVVRNGSTGKIATNLQSQLASKGYNVTFFYGRGRKSTIDNQIRIDNPLEVYVHAFLSRLTGLQGFYSRFATIRMFNEITRRNIDTIILINPHAYYLNEHLFYNFVAKRNLSLLYIVPDEYAYLGNCTNEPICERYLTGCGKCPNIHQYPNSWFVDSCPEIMRNKETNYKLLKKVMFVGPGYVIANLNKSYLGKFMPSAILDEAIDIDLYHPYQTNDMRTRLNIDEDKIVILCVAPLYKGVEYFKNVAKYFHNDTRYVFIHVGKDSEILEQSNYIHIDFVKENCDLAKLYSLADLFLFPSMADTMSNACLEALACGTPLLVFNISGMPYLLDETVGTMVEPKNVEQLIQVVRCTTKKTKSMEETCRKYAEKRFDIKSYADKVIGILENIQ